MEERADYLPVLEYLTPEQVKQVNEAIHAILEKSGYGKITIIIENNHPRFIAYEVTNELRHKLGV